MPFIPPRTFSLLQTERSRVPAQNGVPLLYESRNTLVDMREDRDHEDRDREDEGLQANAEI